MSTTPVYVVSGTQNIQAIFSRDLAQKVGNEDIMVQRVFPVLYRMNKDEIGRFANDKTGRGRPALLSGEGADHHDKGHDSRRYWAEYEHLHSEFLSRPRYLGPLIEVFQRLLSSSLDHQYPQDSGEWSLQDLCRRTVIQCAQ